MANARRSKTGPPTPPDSANDTNSLTNAQDDRDERPGGYSSDEIAARAYELYLARGAADGQDFDDWIAAERELSTTRSQGQHRSTGNPPGEPTE